MGTRNLTMVIDQNGEKKVAQYGQWDGYPSGVGVSVLEFLKNKELLDKFKSNLPKVRFLDEDGKDKEFIESYNKNAPEWSNEPDLRTDKQKEWFETFCSRNLAEKVLENIANSKEDEILLSDREESAKGGDSWIEWVYVIDLKENALSVYDGTLNEKPTKVYKLDNLPTKDVFIEELEGVEEED